MSDNNTFDTPGSPFYSERKRNITEIITSIPDNTINLIDAKRIRDSIWTIWKRIDEVVNDIDNITNPTYQNNNKIPVKIGGIDEGVDFSTPITYTELFNKLLYPHISPHISITKMNYTDGKIEYGNNLSGDNSIIIKWDITKGTSDIQSLIMQIGTDSFIINTNSEYSGEFIINNAYNYGFTYSQTNTPPETSIIITFSVYDTDGYYNSSFIEYKFMNKIYWGNIDIGSEVDLNLNPEHSYNINITRNIILNLSGAGANGHNYGNELTTTKSKKYYNINGNGKHLIFAWPSNFENAYDPKFIVNGMINTSFTRLKHNWPLNNTHGFVTNYEVWISNTELYSPIDLEII